MLASIIVGLITVPAGDVRVIEGFRFSRTVTLRLATLDFAPIWSVTQCSTVYIPVWWKFTSIDL
ncbi:hypothetical protein D3C80_1619540 [compost metagenome]